MSATIKIILDTRRIKTKTNEYPIKLRVTFERVTENYQTIFDLSQPEFKKLSATRVSEDLQALREKLKAIERTAENAVEKLDPFTFGDFEKDYIKGNSLFRRRKSNKINLPSQNDNFDYSPFEKRFTIFKDDHSKSDCISYSFFSYIKSKLKEGRIGAAVCMHCSYKSLMKFRGNVCFREITVSYLNQTIINIDFLFIGRRFLVLCPFSSVSSNKRTSPGLNCLFSQCSFNSISPSIRIRYCFCGAL